MGLLVAAMLAADMSTDSSYMLTWGSVIYNDILAPFRRRRWSEQTRPALEPRASWPGSASSCCSTASGTRSKGDLWTYLRRDRHHLPGQHVDAADRLLLLEAGQQLGRRRGDRRRGAVLPVAYLVFEQTASPLARSVGPYWSGLAAYAGAALAMVVGSVLGQPREVKA